MTGWYNSSWRARFLEYRKEGDGWSHPLLLCDKTHRRRTMMSGDDRQNSPSISRQNRPSATVKIPTLQEKKNIEFFFLRKGFPSQKNIQLGGESNRGKYTPLMNFSRGLNFNRLNGLSKTKLKQLNWCQVHRQKRPLQKFPSIFSENRGSFRIR